MSKITKGKTALVFLNMGGPHTLDQVHPFLSNLFHDKDLIPLPAQKRTPQIIEQYRQIGGGSPIRKWTQAQADAVCESLNRSNPETAPHIPYIAFRYAAPLTDETILKMKEDKIERAVAFTLYPQYSCSTTGSSLNEMVQKLKTLDKEKFIKWSVIDRWATLPGLCNAFANSIRRKLLEYPEKERDDVVLLFSAHSLPMTVVNRGDTYPAEVASTVQKVMELLNFQNPYRLIWQSQVGPQPWLGPKTESVIKGYGKLGRKNLLVVPIAFVSDHIETLFEVDIEYGELAEKVGISGFKRADSLNDDPVFIDAMSGLIKSHLNSDRKMPTQLKLRCPECVNPKCIETRDFFLINERVI